MSSNIIYVQTEMGISRIPEHSCQCDECKLLDPHDAETLRLCRAYLNGELSLDKWREEMVGNEVGPLDVAYNKAMKQFSSGSIQLSDAVEFLLFDSEGHCDGTDKFSERDFKLRLGGLAYGYEVRQRNVHHWKKE